MPKIIHLQLTGLEITHSNAIQESYFSFTFQQTQYFSSTFDHEFQRISDDIFLTLHDNKIPQCLQLQRWENHMIIFYYQVDISELKNRTVAKKKVQTRQGEILSMMISIYEEEEIMLSDKYISNISQHYLFIEDLFFTQQKSLARANGASYFVIDTSNNRFILPVRNSTIVVKLPDTIVISSYKNNEFAGKSQILDFTQLADNMKIDLNNNGSFKGSIQVKMKWGINLHQFQFDKNLLLDSNEIVIYDIQLKFDNPGEMINSKFKINYGSKVFDFTDQLSNTKITKIKKIAYFIIKSDLEQIDLIMQRNGKISSHVKMSSGQLKPYALNVIKKKFNDIINPNKFFGFVKFKAEKAKNVSLPQNNRYWREYLKRRSASVNLTIAIEQISVYFQENIPLNFVAKCDNEERQINTVCNLNYFSQQNDLVNEILELNLKGQDNIYLIVKQQLKKGDNSADFIGIAVLNTFDLRLGCNICQFSYFKNQERIGAINCIINKIVFWPILKPLFQQEITSLSRQLYPVDLFLNKIEFSPYYYTYRYDSKKELYCITEVNRIKKVLILETQQHDPLTFFTVSGSDNLNFLIEDNQIIKFKFTFLVSDLGHEEEIYGAAIFKINTDQLNKQKQIKIKNMSIYNDFGVDLGHISVEISKGTIQKASPKNPTEKDIISGSFDLSQASFDTQNISKKIGRHPSRRYSGGDLQKNKLESHDFLRKNTHIGKEIKEIKLPIIKQKNDKQKQTFKDLFHLMKVRKRGHGGNYEESRLNDKKNEQKQRQSFDLRKIQQSNPNLDRNLQILFPKKPVDGRRNQIKSKQNEYEDKLRGLRSVMNEISMDMGEIEPTIRESHHDVTNYNNAIRDNQWEGNEFGP